MSQLSRLIDKNPRVVVGLMSGTSLDGVDAVVVHLGGSGRGMVLSTLGFVSVPYTPELRHLILRNSNPVGSSVLDVSQLNARLSLVYAEAAHAAVREAGLLMEEVDLVGCHGQTVHHVPVPRDCAGEAVRSSLQLGDPAVLANLLNVPVVGDFRTADMALGGQGAPLVPYFDYVYFTSDAESRLLLNIGGIANMTVLSAGTTRDEIVAFDTGPGNMLMDLVARHFFEEPFDPDGSLAARGEINHSLLAHVLEQEYFMREPPKSTGREAFGEAFAQEIGLFELEPHDALATATALTSYSIYQAYARFVRDRVRVDALVVSGGGARNRTLMDQLVRSFGPIKVATADAYGIDVDAKEAICFAVLAHEALNGIPTSMPSVTGASRPTILGKICVVAGVETSVLQEDIPRGN